MYTNMGMQRMDPGGLFQHKIYVHLVKKSKKIWADVCIMYSKKTSIKATNFRSRGQKTSLSIQKNGT